MKANILMWLISFLPIVVLLFSISYFKLSSRNSAFISLSLTIISALYIYKLNLSQLRVSIGKGAFLGFYVILIIIGAVLLYNIVDKAGGFETIKEFMEILGNNKGLQFIGLTWAFTGFIQGVSGFGVPVAIVGSLLIGMGYNPLMAITAVLVGHSWAISFGSMGSSFFALQLVTNLDSVELGIILALFLIIPIFTTGIAAAYIYGGTKEVKNNLKYIIPLGSLMSLLQLISAYGDFAQIGSLLAGFAGSLYFLIILIVNSGLSFKESIFFRDKNMTLLTAIFPYAILIVSVLFFQIPTIKNFIPETSISLSFPGYTTGLGYNVSAEQSYSPIALFSHPIFFLLLSSFSGVILYLSKNLLNLKKLKLIAKSSLESSVSSAVNVFLLLILAIIMKDSGMIFNFAKGAANISGTAFPILSPMIGILGSFLTGSNTSSNVLFGAFQVNTADLINISPKIIASTQSIGGALGSAIAPAKIILGTVIMGIKNSEGKIIKKCLTYTLGNGLLIGLIAFFITKIF